LNFWQWVSEKMNGAYSTGVLKPKCWIDITTRHTDPPMTSLLPDSRSLWHVGAEWLRIIRNQQILLHGIIHGL
jgi:hypothetical protein